MTQESMTFADFIRDEDGDYSLAQFISLARRLLKEGRRPDRVFRAMLRAAYEVSVQHSIAEHRDFVKYAAEDSTQWLERIEDFCDEMLEAAERDKH